MGKRVEWFKWIIHYRTPKIRVWQISLVFAFEVYYQLCKLRGYPVTHILEGFGKPASGEVKPGKGKYILIWPRLPLSIRLLDRISPFGRYAHAEYIAYTPEKAEEIRKSGQRMALMEIRVVWGELRFAGTEK